MSQPILDEEDLTTRACCGPLASLAAPVDVSKIEYRPPRKRPETGAARLHGTQTRPFDLLPLAALRAAAV